MMFSEIYNILNLILDNNVKRIVRLLEFTRSDNLEKIPADVVKVFVEKVWAKVTYLNSKNSEQICIKIRPKHEMWILNELCPLSYV